MEVKEAFRMPMADASCMQLLLLLATDRRAPRWGTKKLSSLARLDTEQRLFMNWGGELGMDAGACSGRPASASATGASKAAGISKATGASKAAGVSGAIGVSMAAGSSEIGA